MTVITTSTKALIARGIISQLRTWAPIVPTILPKMPKAMAAELHILCDRAAAVTPDSTNEELESVLEIFLEFSGRYGLLSPAPDMKERVSIRQ